MDQGLLDEFSAECGLTDPFRVEVGLKGDSSSQVYEFRQPFLVVGRRAGSDLMLDHWLVSRRHAYLQLIEGRFFCVDLGSRTGTHGGDATERSGWLDPIRAIQIGPYSVQPDLPPVPDRDYPPLPIVTWTIHNREDSPNQWTMNRGLALIGRSPACRIRIPEADVSRFHCSLVLTTSGVWAIDLLSQRPVVVNGAPMRFARIMPGDELQVGRHLLTPQYDYSLIEAASANPFSPSITTEATRPPNHPPKPKFYPRSESDAAVDAAVEGDQLPALSPTVIIPNNLWNLRPASIELSEEDALKLADPTVGNLVQQLGAMQQQSFDQMHQMMMMVFEGFVSLHRETSSSIREEVEEVRKLSQEIESLKAETARLAEASTMSMQTQAFQKASGQPVPPRNGHSVRREGPPVAKPSPKVVTPLPDPQVDFHAQLCERLSSIETERKTRWQKIVAMMAAKS